MVLNEQYVDRQECWRSQPFVAPARQSAVPPRKPVPRSWLSRIPAGGTITRAVSRIAAKIKRFVLPTSLFEQMGFYLSWSGGRS